MTRPVLEALFLLFDNKNDKQKQSFPPPSNHRYASGSGVLGVQKPGGGNKNRSSGEMGLEEGGTGEDDDPDI